MFRPSLEEVLPFLLRGSKSLEIRAFTYFDMGYSCALAWVLVAIVSVFTVILFKTQKSWVYYEAGRE